MGTANTSYRVVEVAESGLDSRSIGQFIEEHWRKRIALSVPRFFDWQFTDSPANRGRNRCLLILDRDDRIFGFMGVTVREFNLDGRRVVGAELTTWILNEEVRGLGLGKAIVGRLQESYEAIIGMGISDSALPIYATHGFKYMRHLSRYVRIHDAERVASISKLDALGERMVRKAPAPCPAPHATGAAERNPRYRTPALYWDGSTRIISSAVRWISTSRARTRSSRPKSLLRST